MTFFQMNAWQSYKHLFTGIDTNKFYEEHKVKNIVKSVLDLLSYQKTVSEF